MTERMIYDPLKEFPSEMTRRVDSVSQAHHAFSSGSGIGSMTRVPVVRPINPATNEVRVEYVTNSASFTEYWLDGALHRPWDEGPAVQRSDTGAFEYRTRGLLHRPVADGPAHWSVLHIYGHTLETCVYAEDGVLHRPWREGPAMSNAMKSAQELVYFERGVLNRGDGLPAFIKHETSGARSLGTGSGQHIFEWWRTGYRRHGEVDGSDLPYHVRVDSRIGYEEAIDALSAATTWADMKRTGFVTMARWCDALGRPHGTNGPSEWHSNGAYKYAQHGIKRRLDGPVMFDPAGFGNFRAQLATFCLPNDTQEYSITDLRNLARKENPGVRRAGAYALFEVAHSLMPGLLNLEVCPKTGQMVKSVRKPNTRTNIGGR